MKRSSLAGLLFGFAALAFAQEKPQIPPTAVPSFAAEPASAGRTMAAPSTANADRPHATSPGVAAKINWTVPKYSPVETPAAKNEDELPDLRDIDKPRNGIIRLPKHLVQEKKEPAFKEREILTPSGEIDLAYKRHPGLRFGSLPFLNNNGVALSMLGEERRLERKAEMEDLVDLYRYSDPKKSAAMKSETDKAFIRHAGAAVP